MGSIDVLDKPLTRDELVAGYVAIADDPRFATVVGKVELNAFGQILVTPPPAVWHQRTGGRLIRSLVATLEGEAFQECPIAIPASGVLVPDVVWCSFEFLGRHRGERIFSAAPEICIEVLSPSNTTEEIAAKRDAYLRAGAIEVWIVDPVEQVVNCFDAGGARSASQFVVDLSRLFEA